jgi:protein SCO1
LTTKNQTSLGKFVLVITIIALVFSIALSLWVKYNQPFQLQAATIWPQSVTLAPFSLTNDQNQSFTNENIKNKWTLFFFGYTNCPDVCPTVLHTLNTIAQTFKETSDIYQKIQYVFVSVDPSRDTPQVLNKYVHYFNKEFIGVTGSISELQQFSMQMSVPFGKIVGNPDKEKNYQVDHGSSVVVTNPQGQKFAVFGSPHDALKISSDLKYFVTSIVEN